MMALVLMVFYFLAVVLDTNQKLKPLAGRVLGAAKRVFDVSIFQYYALGDGISAILRRNPGKIIPKPRKPLGPARAGVIAKIYLIFRGKFSNMVSIVSIINYCVPP